MVQAQNSKYEEYIRQYSELAVEQMKQYKIPASITLAQGILESGAGCATLARCSNNHFGIKCGSDWRGPTISHDDDERGECFRVYSNPKESYIDHSKFLSGRSRYAALFNLNITDYKGWAYGLKRAGYATNPSYANNLISIIESYQLYRFDSRKESRNVSQSHWAALATSHQILLANKLLYVRVHKGDTFETLSRELGISERKLRRYNDLHKGYTLIENDIIYLKGKHTRALHTMNYIVRDSDSMHSISQIYGIKLKSLYRMNGLKPDYLPQVGDILRLK
ncbi:MAG: glucosaminidase domain-containing protein [Bacteroidaceae bacterium]